MRGRFCKPAIGFALLFGAPAVICAVAGISGIRLNATPSVPTGLYFITTGPTATYVEFCPPGQFGPMSVERGYRARQHRGCSDGGEPLLKPVVARGGDVVEVAPVGIKVNGRLIPNTAPRSRDTAGWTLTPWPPGRYPVANGTIWIASSYNSRSFDSRYFGPIPVTAVRNWLRPLLTE